MNAQDVYNQFGTPRGLQEHMLTVAGLVCALEEYWTGAHVDWKGATKAALLHDIGNVIKFDLSNFPELLGVELPRLEYWRNEQKRLIEKYGADEHIATDKMLDELNIGTPIREAIQAKSFGNAKEAVLSNNWLVKILLYCDMRTMPDRIATLEERTTDLKVRLKKYGDRPDFPELVAACKAIEQEVQESLKIPLTTVVSPENASKHREELLRFDITKSAPGSTTPA